MIRLIEQRLRSFRPETEQDEENALREAFQECILLALARSGFFTLAAFHGGTALRVLHGLDRFSEDIDLSLLAPDRSFRWERYGKELKKHLLDFGVEVEVKEKAEIDSAAVRKMVVNDHSLTKFLELRPIHHARKKLRVKLEIDTNPPQNQGTELGYVNFPEPFALLAHDSPTLFAGKCHALLCRNFVKGRDWYDFLWYARMGITPNFGYLAAALEQTGPWAGKKQEVNAAWLTKKLRVRIGTLNWQEVANDVAPFLRAKSRTALEVWSAAFFDAQLATLANVWNK